MLQSQSLYFWFHRVEWWKLTFCESKVVSLTAKFSNWRQCFQFPENGSQSTVEWKNRSGGWQETIVLFIAASISFTNFFHVYDEHIIVWFFRAIRDLSSTRKYFKGYKLNSLRSFSYVSKYFLVLGKSLITALKSIRLPIHKGFT